MLVASNGPFRPPALAIVQHGHQHLITDGYDNREGLSELLEGFAAIFALHLKHRVPLNLHLSGILLEAIAWHSPAFFGWIRELRQAGLLELVGSAYAQNIMTVSHDAHNLRQLNESLRLYQRHLDIPPTEIQTLWVPERVWQTTKLAPVIRSRRLLNGGYRSVLIDDRLVYAAEGPNGGYEGSERQRFDASTLPASYLTPPDTGLSHPAAFAGNDHLRPWRIAESGGLVALPISGPLRYSVPPQQDDQWQRLHEVLRLVGEAGPEALAIYGDDLEKAAAVGPWTPDGWTPANVEPYGRLLEWVGQRRDVEPVLLTPFLAAHPPSGHRAIAPGTFQELAQHWHAGEDYQGWWRSAEWQPYRGLLAEAEALLTSAPAECDECDEGGLWDLAWKQLMACSYETGWHDVHPDGQRRPAPWAKAVAAHVRHVFVIAAAAEWQRLRDGRPHVERMDLDRDGVEEVVLKNDFLYAVFSPTCGGRLVYLFDLTPPGGRLVIGNPADDWNWQEEANRFMDVPPNHPGAFADIGHEHDQYEVRSLHDDAECAQVRLVNCRNDSPLAGTEKTFWLTPRDQWLEARYQVPESVQQVGVQFALSPDYLALLRGGRRVIRPFEHQLDYAWVRGYRAGPTAAWVLLPTGEPLTWERPHPPACGHGLLVRVSAHGPQFELSVGVGELVAAHKLGTAERTLAAVT